MLHDAPCFALRTADCEDIRIENVKIIGQWRYNSDGIDLYNSRHALVKSCFVRTFDDCVVLKGGYSVNGVQLDRVTLSDIAVEDCVLWNDWGRALEIGAERPAATRTYTIYSSRTSTSASRSTRSASRALMRFFCARCAGFRSRRSAA